MPKYGLPTRKNRPLYPLKSGPSIPSGAGLRYFRRNEGSTDYISIPEVVLNSDFVIEFNAFSLLTTGYLLAKNDGTYRVYYNSTNSTFTITSDNANSEFSGAYPLNVINNIKIVRTSGVLNVLVNGVSMTKGLSNADGRPFIFNSIGDQWGSPTGISRHKGVILDLDVTDDSTVIRSYPASDNGNTIHDKVSGQNGAVVNGNANDWGLFDKQTNGDWLRYSVNYDWTDPSQLAGWNLIGNTAEVVGEKLRLTSTTVDPQIERGFNLIGTTNTSVKIVSRSVSGTNKHNKLFWKTTASPSYSGDKSLDFGEDTQSNTTVVKNGPDLLGYFTYEFDMTQIVTWVGEVVTGIRLDFTNTEVGAVTDIDLIRVVEVLKNA